MCRHMGAALGDVMEPRRFSETRRVFGRRVFSFLYFFFVASETPSAAPAMAGP